MPPQDGDDELLEEIDDDAIVAQQAPAHAPAPRAHVTDEARTIVVEEPPAAAGETSRMRALSRGRNDPTMLIRTLPHAGPSGYAPGSQRGYPLAGSAPKNAWPSWLPWLVWGVAGIIAFAIGGALAVVAARRDAAPPPPAPSPVSTAITR
ncbi:MAG: hypothetical protein IPI67_25530 [Myxococcales bacterium]|nr:hypothetical protein [Myxococcales bacterium]